MQHIADEIYDKIKIAYNYWTHKYESDGIMENTINNIFRDINELCYIHGLNPEEVRAANIRKLQVRFPNKFDMGEATERNLDAERNAITNKKD